MTGTGAHRVINDGDCQRAQRNPAKTGADNKLVCFLHPKGTNGVLVELCQERINEEMKFEL